MVRDPVSGFLIDSRDGTVVDDRPIDLGPDWRSADGARAGPLIGVSSTVIGTAWDGGDSPSIRRRLEALRLRKWQGIVYSGEEDRSIAEASSVINRVSAQAGLPKPCIDEALKVFSDIVGKGLLRGRSVEVVAAACLYLACRNNRTPRSAEELGRYVGIDGGRVMEAVKFVMSSLRIKVKLSDPIDYVRVLGSKLGVDWDVIAEAINILRRARSVGRNSVAGKNPIGIAAAAIYMAAMAKGKGLTMKDIARAVGVSRATIRERYRELKALLSQGRHR